MDKENFKGYSKNGRKLLLSILFFIILILIPSILGLYALDNDNTVLLVICTIISIFSILTNSLKNVFATIVSFIISIVYATIYSIEHPIVYSIIVVPLFTLIYDVFTFIFVLLTISIEKRKKEK